MRYRVTWLFVWVTLAFWTGCGGENQNHRMNQEHVPLFREGYPTQPGGVGPSAEAGDEADVIVEPGPSVTGVERDDWGPASVTAVDGRVPHHPRYFKREGYGWDWRVTEDRPSPLDRDEGIEVKAYRVTAGARASIGSEDVASVGLGMGKFALDMVTFPYRVVRTPPWEIHYSPEWE